MMNSRRDIACDNRAAQTRALGIRTNIPISAAEIDATMSAVIQACLLDKKEIERADFLRAMVPDSEIDHRFPRLLAQARQANKGRRR